MTKSRASFVVAVAILFLAAGQMFGQVQPAQEVTALLQEFMQAAGTGDRAVFEKFFADDVIYTRATGAVITKADIMGSLQKSASPQDAKSSYSAQDITLHEYGDAIVVAFRLEARTEGAGTKTETTYYRNTGTFVRRNRRWQAVAWQATKIAEAASTH
jgi:ketosteroid isomerase-like protein